MRALDIGCGTGNVTLLVSEMVGSGGWIVDGRPGSTGPAAIWSVLTFADQDHGVLITDLT
ncbi:MULTISPECIES: hypothetical protein [unclassified Mesorhizobium]|uniref:hypothetical protein n=1 Tax=unclassified Mesorhizobium TaxID=325217 RepID=UPI0033389586